jgi:hypothetical protein
MSNLNSIICTITSVFYHMDIFTLHATTFGSLFPNLKDLESRLEGCGIRGIDYLFFFKCDPQPDSPIQPKARGLLHMECDFSIAHHI